ncbi:MAG: TfoX/Sxy family protein [Calditrichaceae bacterium]
MSYDRTLSDRIDKIVSGWTGIEIKKMFGGVGYLVNGNMCCGIHKNYLVLRMDPETSEKIAKEPYSKPFDITGRPMKGWVMVESDGCNSQSDLERYMDIAKKFTDTLPVKK